MREPGDHVPLKPMATAVAGHLELCRMRCFQLPPTRPHGTPDPCPGPRDGFDARDSDGVGESPLPGNAPQARNPGSPWKRHWLHGFPYRLQRVSAASMPREWPLPHGGTIVMFAAANLAIDRTTPGALPVRSWQSEQLCQHRGALRSWPEEGKLKRTQEAASAPKRFAAANFSETSRPRLALSARRRVCDVLARAAAASRKPSGDRAGRQELRPCALSRVSSVAARQ